MELLRAYDGEASLLGSTERYFLELIEIPSLPSRLTSWATKQRFASQAADLSHRISILSGGLDRVCSSHALHKALGMMLALGNAINAQSSRSQASGFRLDASLPQICAMRTNGQGAATGGSLLSFLARHAEQMADGSLAQLGEETAGLAEACKIEPEELQREVLALRKEVESVRAALERPAQSASTAAGGVAEKAEAEKAECGDQFATVMRHFVVEAEGRVVRIEEELAGLVARGEESCRFFCEASPSLSSAHALLLRLKELSSGMAAAVAQHLSQATRAGAAADHKQRQQQQQQQQQHAALMLSPRRAAASKPVSTTPVVEFEACDASLKRILEDEPEDEAGEELAQPPTPTRKLRRVGNAAAGLPPSAADARAAQAAELQALFLRRASGMSIGANKRA